MATGRSGVVAAGHPLTAQAGARVLRDGGNAVDAAIGAVLTSFVAEPLLTGLGAGGYMLVAGPGREPVLLDFFVAAPTRAGDGSEAELQAVEVSFGDAVQIFHVGPASCGVYGTPAGVCAASRRWGSIPLADLAAPAVELAREGVPLNAGQAYIAKILHELLVSTPESSSLWAPGGRPLREGDALRDPALADALTILGERGSEPFYRGELSSAVVAWMEDRGGSVTAADLAAYSAVEREPVRTAYRDREILTNPPPSAGGTLLAYALALLDRGSSPPLAADVVAAMAAAHAERTSEFVEGLEDPGFLERFMSSRLGSTTHISVLDADGFACSVTCSNGEGSAVIVPGTGIHLNNMMGEADLNPLGWHRHPPGRRMPSMMAPTVVTRAGEVELVLGSAGSNRIRSALLQTIVSVVDRGLDARAAVDAPRLHLEDGKLYVEPGIDLTGIPPDLPTVLFAARNLFFGGVQVALRRDGVLTGAGDPRRGGVAVGA
ncbi:MAG TPA: gamma-glutamyltransferase [Solirubrobacteraceae bacterium]|jgi:gamma-glutamyltranspeptidase/glutathione hydrolase|nr:gamma-glutamyltransferase [Solirubrobacteraceae bacterium]